LRKEAPVNTRTNGATWRIVGSCKTLPLLKARAESGGSSSAADFTGANNRVGTLAFASATTIEVSLSRDFSEAIFDENVNRQKEKTMRLHFVHR
jgi:hypothetical protein